MGRQLLHETLGLDGGKLSVECDDEKVGHAEVTDQRDFVLSRSEKMRRVMRPQYFHWMWIEGHDHRRPALFLGVAARKLK